VTTLKLVTLLSLEFGVAEMQEIYEEEGGNVISAEEEGQSDWSLEECQELLGEVTVEDQDLLRKVMNLWRRCRRAFANSPDAPENCANEAAQHKRYCQHWCAY
jgi:hypothetical protein